jgi:hypothetical protein
VNAVLLGDRDDARGFGLAGWPALPCRDAREMESALEKLGTEGDDLVLVLVSPAAAALAPGALEAFRGRPGAPIVLVLP